MKLIALNGKYGGGLGKHTLVDDEDFEFLNQWKWYLTKYGYVIRFKYIGFYNKKIKREGVLMHRLVTKALKGKEIDHVNQNKLDNRKINLRFCSRSQNAFNSLPSKRNKSGYRGVFKRNLIYLARITVKGKHIHLGTFKNPKKAYLAYKEAAIKYFGNFLPQSLITK